ncbi:MAG: nucleoside-diphosphate sugar epimerase/dehydratase [Dehalococcoidia bacterium]
MAPVEGGSKLSRFVASESVHVAGAMALDVVVVVVAYAAALILRFDSSVPEESVDTALWAVPLIAAAYITANLFFHVYRTIWIYGSLGDVIQLFRPVLLVTAVIFAVNVFAPHWGAFEGVLAHDPDGLGPRSLERDLPLGVVLIAGALIFPGMAAVKMRSRLLSRMPWASPASRRLLIVGGGHTGQALVRELQNSPGLNLQPIGYLDDDPKKHGRRMHGLRVFGPTSDLGASIRANDVDAVAIAIPRAPGAMVREIVGICQRLEVPVQIVPGVEKWVGGQSHDTLRDVTLDDLLGRDPVQIDYAACSETVRDKVVVVTGAAGSIGSELCRQVLAFEPRQLHMVDNNESGLYEFELELTGISPETAIHLWVANVVEQERVEEIVRTVRPDLIYHAAALKHVPLMEDHPGEAFRVNVLGTLNVARAAKTFGVEKFVLISTDKAVRPSSIMGATKRIAELLVLGLARESELTTYSAVRFGNVMGSRGSVVPKFMRQIELGGPVTVMHPDMMRYFISIPEAVSLVIQAGTFGGYGNIYMLDMGEEINILELAERMIRLRGLRPGRDIEVVFTGPRPGEKLREELVADFEQMEATEHPKVNLLSASVEVTESEVFRLIEEIRASMWDDPEELRRRLHLVARKYSLEDEGAAESPAGEEAAR